MITTLVLSVLVQFPQGDLGQLTTLRPGELVRCYRRGGRTRNGLFQELIVVTPKWVYIKSNTGSTVVEQDAHSRSSWASALKQANPTILRSNKRDNPMFPSAYDAVDVFLSYRYQGQVIRWTNEAYEEPRSGLSLLSMLLAHPQP